MSVTKRALRQDVMYRVGSAMAGAYNLGAVSSVVSASQFYCKDLITLPSNELNDCQVYFYGGGADGQTGFIKTHSQDTTNGALITLYAATAPAVTTADSIEVYRTDKWRKADYDSAIAAAHRYAEDTYLVELTDDSLTMETARRDYPIPSTFRYLAEVYADVPGDAGQAWAPGSSLDVGTLAWGSHLYNGDLGLNSASGQQQLAQPFKTSGSYAGWWCKSVRLYLRAIGSPTGNLTATIQTTSGSSFAPTGTTLQYATSATVAASGLSSEPIYVAFTFPAPVFIQVGTTYAIVLQTTGSTDASNYVAWGAQSSSAYANGFALSYNGSAWSTVAGSNAAIFALARGPNTERWREIPRTEWEVLPNDAYLRIKYPLEGYRLKLVGQGQATAPTADTDPIGIPYPFALAKSCALVMRSRPGGPQTDADARDRWALAHDAEAQRELALMHVQPRPNSRVVRRRS